MEIKKYTFDEDYQRIKDFLRECYYENHNMTCWLPERFEDLVYRLDAMYVKEYGEQASEDYIYIWEENSKIAAVILPDEDCVCTSIRNGYEYLFPEMIEFAQQHLKGLFSMQENGKVNFLVVADDCLTYKTEALLRMGYVRDAVCDYNNAQNPMENTEKIVLPEGFRQVYGEEIQDEAAKNIACHLGFHPDDEGKLEQFDYNMYGFKARKQAPMYQDSFESLIVADNGEICSYSFCYVDKITKTAFVEPVSTREKFRGRGIGKAMLQGIINRLKEEGITACYVNSYADWRRAFYNSAGFATQNSVGFWFKEI